MYRQRTGTPRSDLPRLVKKIKRFRDVDSGFVEIQTTDYRELTKMAIDNIIKKSREYRDPVKYCAPDALNLRIASCFRANIFFRLKADLLPSWRDQVSGLCEVLQTDRSNPPNDFPAIFQTIHEKAMGLDQILGEILSSISSLWDLAEGTLAVGAPSEVTRTSLVKDYRLTEALDIYPWKHALHFICELAQRCAIVLPVVNRSLYSMETLSDLDHRFESRFGKFTVVGLVRSLNRPVNALIKALSEPEFNQCQYRWKWMAERMGVNIARVYRLTGDKPNILNDRRPPMTHLILTKTRMHAFIPILKLARLFFKKISKRSNSELHIVSKMTVDQLTVMRKSTDALISTLERFLDHDFWLAHGDSPIGIKLFFVEIAESFNIPMETLNEYYNFSTSKRDRIANRKAREWCRIWADRFDLAVNHLSRAFGNSQY